MTFLLSESLSHSFNVIGAMPFLRLLILFYECPKTGLHASKVKKH